jgi:hypothetical protein
MRIKSILSILKIIILFSLAVSLSTINYSCKNEGDDPNSETDTIFHDQEFLDYWFFPKGSWWVYQRTDTNAIIYDTAIVVYEENYFQGSTYYTNTREQKTGIRIEHSNDYFKYPNSQIDSKAGQLLIAAGEKNTLKSLNTKTPYFDYLYLLFYPFDRYDEYKSFININLSVLLNLPYGKVEDAIMISIHLSQINHVWMKKDIGIVKYHHFDDTVWELKDYFINK